MRRHFVPIGLGLITALLVAPAFVHAGEVWSTTEEFSFGFLVPPISLGLLLWRRGSIRASVGVGSTSGLLLVLPSLATYLLAERTEIHALAGLAVPPLLIGIAAFLFGWRLARRVAFPLGFLAFGLGLFRGLLDSLGFALQAVTAVGAASLAQVMGVSVDRSGLVLSSDTFAFVVAEPCSGMSSLVSLLALASLWIYVVRGSIPARAAVVLSALPLVVVANSTRVALVLLIASWFGQDAALGFFHSLSSLLLFLLSVLGLAFISRLVGCKDFSLAASY
jgi:exosortase